MKGMTAFVERITPGTQTEYAKLCIYPGATRLLRVVSMVPGTFPTLSRKFPDVTRLSRTADATRHTGETNRLVARKCRVRSNQTRRNTKNMKTLNLFLPALMAGLMGMIPAGRATAQTFTNLHSFAKAYPPPITTLGDGAGPGGTLVLSGNTLFGTTGDSPGYESGTVFKVNTDGTGFTNLHVFTVLIRDTNSDGSLISNTNSDGADPSAGLVLSGNTLYGTAQQGGSWGGGTVFAINTDGTGFTNLFSFTGSAFQSGLIMSNNTLYGTRQYGESGAGAVFAIKTDGTDFTNLHNFNGYDGYEPSGELVLSGNTLYGTAANGGTPDGVGTVFAVNTDGTGFTNLYNFTAFHVPYPYTNSDGFGPGSELVLSGKTLYGTASQGGVFGQGTIFAINTDGSGFTNLYNFTGGDDGADPSSGLILSGNTLYGTTYSGGIWGGGTAFSLTLPPVNAPQLAIICSGLNVVVSWPTNSATAFALQSATNLLSPVWSAVSPAPTVLDGQNVVTNSISDPQMFFRLSR
jgi:uncharacterized repeat protein (TIGR03803 family)